MAAKLPWFDRKFDFSFPVEAHPDIIERLRGTPARVEERVQSFPQQRLTGRDGDTWSIQENVGHLLDVEPLWAGRVDDILAGSEIMREADLTNRKTHEANHHAVGIETITSALREIRQQLVSRLEGLDTESFARSSLHPRLRRPMRIVDLCLFVADHDDYHLARMTELSRHFSNE